MTFGNRSQHIKKPQDVSPIRHRPATSRNRFKPVVLAAFVLASGGFVYAGMSYFAAANWRQAKYEVYIPGLLPKKDRPKGPYGSPHVGKLTPVYLREKSGKKHLLMGTQMNPDIKKAVAARFAKHIDNGGCKNPKEVMANFQKNILPRQAEIIKKAQAGPVPDLKENLARIAGGKGYEDSDAVFEHTLCMFQQMKPGSSNRSAKGLLRR